ncbi:MAG: PDZ domain-containing protein [Solimonas sp.]
MNLRLLDALQSGHRDPRGRWGWFGLAVDVEREGWFFNPVLRAATVRVVARASPAGLAGVETGDRIVSANGVPLAGRPLLDLLPHFTVKAGGALRLRMLRPQGESYLAELVAA